MVTIKIPSIDLRDDPAYLKRFMMEEWVARRIDSPHVLNPCLLQRKRNFLYVAMADLIPGLHRRVGTQDSLVQVALISLGVGLAAPRAALRSSCAPSGAGCLPPCARL